MKIHILLRRNRRSEKYDDEKRTTANWIENLKENKNKLIDSILKLENDVDRIQKNREECDRNEAILCSLYDKGIVDENGNLR